VNSIGAEQPLHGCGELLLGDVVGLGFRLAGEGAGCEGVGFWLVPLFNPVNEGCEVNSTAASARGCISMPKREWTVENRIPARTVTLLSGDGGVGKTILGLHLSTATLAFHAVLPLSPLRRPHNPDEVIRTRGRGGVRHQT
jgi:hypothetical protein